MLRAHLIYNIYSQPTRVASQEIVPQEWILDH